jgi:hypothetical protein
MGNGQITWTNGSSLGVLLTDYGSSVGSYRTIISTEGVSASPLYAPPTLQLMYSQSQILQLPIFDNHGGTNGIGSNLTLNWTHINAGNLLFVTCDDFYYGSCYSVTCNNTSLASLGSINAGGRNTLSLWLYLGTPPSGILNMQAKFNASQGSMEGSADSVSFLKASYSGVIASNSGTSASANCSIATLNSNELVYTVGSLYKSTTWGYNAPATTIFTDQARTNAAQWGATQNANGGNITTVATNANTQWCMYNILLDGTN